MHAWRAPSALRAHRLAELLEHAQAHRAGPLARGDALGAATLLRLAEGQLSALACLAELLGEARDLLAGLLLSIALELAIEPFFVERLRDRHQATPFRGVVHSTASIPGCHSWICAFGGCMARRNL